MSEKAIQNRIIKKMEGAGWYVRKNHGSIYNVAGIPDLICHKEGQTLYIEVKQPGKQLTVIQRRQMGILREYGISSVCARHEDDVRIFWDESQGTIEERIRAARSNGC